MESMIDTMVFVSDGEEGRGGNLTYVAELCAPLSPPRPAVSSPSNPAAAPQYQSIHTP